jgi:uncharacterized protein
LKFIAYLVVLFGFSSSLAGPKEDFFKAVDIDAAHIVSAMLAQGFDPNERDDKGQVPLFLALRSESRQVAAALLANPKTDIDAVNPHGETPVMMAAMRGDLALTRQLLDRGASVQREGWTPLHYAASGPDPKVVGLLLDRGAAIDARSPNGTTPLMMAARYGAIDAAEPGNCERLDFRVGVPLTRPMAAGRLARSSRGAYIGDIPKPELRPCRKKPWYTTRS